MTCIGSRQAPPLARLVLQAGIQPLVVLGPPEVEVLLQPPARLGPRAAASNCHVSPRRKLHFLTQVKYSAAPLGYKRDLASPVGRTKPDEEEV